MRHATSWLHIDANGFATAVDTVSGSKYWVVARSRSPGGSGKGDLSSITAYDDKWEPYHSCSDRFEFEAVIIKPGTVL